MGMKDSGIQWIGEIPENWEIKKIKYVYRLITGFTPDTTRDDYYDDDSGHTWISIADMSNSGKVISESDSKISNLYVNLKHPEKVKKGSLLYSFKLSVGKAGFADKDLYTNEAIASFQHNNDVCLPFLYYSSFLIEENANINIYGAKILNQDLIKNSYNIVPPLSEQKLIADFLDDKVSKIDDILTDLNNQVDILQKYKKSIITETVTKGLNPDVKMKDSEIDWIGEIPENWDMKKFKYVGETIDCLHETPDFVANGIPMVRVSEIKEGYLELSTAFEVSYSDYLHFIKRHKPIKGEILIARVGSFGNVTYINNEEEFCIGQNVSLMRTDNLIGKLLYYNLISNFDKEYFNYVAVGGIYKNVTIEHISNIPIIIPNTVNEQQEIVDFLDEKCAQIDAIMKDKQTQIEKMESYKKSLIYEYVTGKKRVKGAEI